MESYDISDNIGPGNPDTPGRRGLSTLPAVVVLASIVEMISGGSVLMRDGNSVLALVFSILLLAGAVAGIVFAVNLQKSLKRQVEAGPEVPMALSIFFLCNAAALFIVTAQFMRL